MLERMHSAMVGEDGSLNLEMALIIGLLVLAVVVALTAVGNGIENKYDEGVDYLDTVPAPEAIGD